MTKSVLYEEKNNICLITLNREDTRNALTPDVINELVKIIENVDKNQNISCAILTGAGKSFSSGGNLHEINEMTGKEKMSQREIENWYRYGIQKSQLPLIELMSP